MYSPDVKASSQQKWRNSILLAAETLEAALGQEIHAATEEKKKELSVQAASQAIATMRASDAWRSSSDLRPIEAKTLEEFGEELLGLASVASSQRDARMAKLQSPSFQSKIMNIFRRKANAKTPSSTEIGYSRTTTPTLVAKQNNARSSNTTFRDAVNTPSDFTPTSSIRSASGFTPSGSFSSGSTVASKEGRLQTQSSAGSERVGIAQSHEGLGISLQVSPPAREEVVPATTNIGTIKVQRDSKVLDRFVPKRDAAFFSQLEHEKQTRIKQQQQRKDSKVDDHSPFLGRLQDFGTRGTQADYPVFTVQDSTQSPVHPALRTPVNSSLRAQSSAATVNSSNPTNLGTEGGNRSDSNSSERSEDRSATPTPHGYNSNSADNRGSPSSSGSSSYSDLSQYEDESRLLGPDDQNDPGTPREDSPTLPPHLAPVFYRPAVKEAASTPVPVSPEPSGMGPHNEVCPITPGTPSSASKPFWQHILDKSGPYKQAYGRVPNDASSTDAITVSDISKSPSERWSTRALRRQKFESAIYNQQTGGGALQLPEDSDTRSLTSSVGSPSSNDISILENSGEAASTASPSPAKHLPPALGNAAKTGLSPSDPSAGPTRSQCSQPASPSPFRIEKTRLTSELPPTFPAARSALPPSPLQFSSTAAGTAPTPTASSTPLRFYGKGSSPEPSPSPLRVGHMGLASTSGSEESPSPLRIHKSRPARTMNADPPSIELRSFDMPLGQMRRDADARRAQQQDTPTRKVRSAGPDPPTIGDKNDQVGDQIDEILASKELQPSKPKIASQMLHAAPSTVTPFARVMADYQDVRRQSQMPKPVFEGPEIPEPASKLEPFANVADEYQHIRRRLQLTLLKAPKDGQPKHPNHDFAWASTNVKCKGKHMKARIATDSAVVSPLLGSFPDPDEQNDGIQLCHSCGKACCHFANQIIVCNSTDDLHQKKLMSISVMTLRGTHPTGLEPWSVLMDCSKCDNVFCPNCGTVEDGQPVCRICLPSTP
jgi:hypothetical protein